MRPSFMLVLALTASRAALAVPVPARGEASASAGAHLGETPFHTPPASPDRHAEGAPHTLDHHSLGAAHRHQRQDSSASQSSSGQSDSIYSGSEHSSGRGRASSGHSSGASSASSSPPPLKPTHRRKLAIAHKYQKLAKVGLAFSAIGAATSLVIGGTAAANAFHTYHSGATTEEAVPTPPAPGMPGGGIW